MSQNLLKNSSFEAGTHHQTFAKVIVPDDWLAFWHDGAASHDPNNEVGYCRPEMKVIPDVLPFKGPNRVHSDSEEPTAQKALMYFAFGKIMDAGIYQQVAVQPGARLCATAWAEGWSNDGFNPKNAHKDNPRWSEGAQVGLSAFYAEEGAVTDDAARNLRFRVGIDPTGGADAWAAAVVWGKAAHIYNAYAQAPAVETVAQAATVTVFLRCDALWPYMRNDAYWDDAELVVVTEPPTQLSLNAAPVLGTARVGSAVMVAAGSEAPLSEVKLQVAGTASAPLLFDVSESVGGARSTWRWILVPDKAGAYTLTFSAAGSPLVTKLQVSP